MVQQIEGYTSKKHLQQEAEVEFFQKPRPWQDGDFVRVNHVGGDILSPLAG